MAMQEIDPSQARVDLDALSLIEWKATPPVPMILGEHQTTVSEVHLVLAGGLGRITERGEQPVLVDSVQRATVSAVLTQVSPEAFTALASLLSRWEQTGLPLRLLEFATSTLVLEDAGNFLTLPPGPLHVAYKPVPPAA